MNITIVIDILFKDVCNMYTVYCTVQYRKRRKAMYGKEEGQGKEKRKK